MLEIIDWEALDSTQRSAVLSRPATADADALRADVAQIIGEVRQRGDAALIEYASRFDGVTIDALRVDPTDIASALARLADNQRRAMQAALANIRRFHQAQVSHTLEVQTSPGVVCRRITRPLDAVGLYVPAGSAPLPSTALMLAVPAAVAGCPRAVIVTPPQTDGRANPSVLAAAALCGIDEVVVAGGAQAIAALAYGTESVAAVDKIFGPGNAWVTEAKLQVARDPAGAACDLPAGPSEVLVIADESAEPEFVAADLLSQAEHGADSQVLLVTPSARLADAVRVALERQLGELSRADVARRSLAAGRLIRVGSLAEAIAVSNAYAPEHLIMQIEDASRWLDAVSAAGSVFLGPWTPESLGDYCSGTNHVLPTYGFARAWSGLAVEDFQRRITVQTATSDGLRKIGPVAITLARMEGLDGHASAVAKRLDKLQGADLG